MSLKDLEIPIGKYMCINGVPGNGASLSAGDVKDLKQRGTGAMAYSTIRRRRCDKCPANCPLGGLMARVVEESKSIYPDID